MKFYLSSFPQEITEEAISVKVNNLPNKKRRPAIELPIVNTPDEHHIRYLNELATKLPFSSIHKTKKYDPL